jgi:endonuclease/exonuclease/phosphatase (EEP) superfamily protein YafD
MMEIAAVVVWVLSALPIAATLLPIVETSRWWVRVWDYPRLQLAVTLGVSAVLQLLVVPMTLPTAALLAVTVACLGWQLSLVYPYTRLAATQVLSAEKTDSSATISILVANVLKDNRDSAAFLRRVRESDPDIIFAVEADAWWDAQIAGIDATHRTIVRHPLENAYGLHLFSRLEVRNVCLQERVEPDVPSVFAEVRLRSGDWVNLHCLHPQPPQIGSDVDERDAELMIVGKEAAADLRPTIVCGDLNDVAWSHTTRLFQRVSGLLDPRIGRGLFPTFHAGYWFARWPLDHVFHDASFRLIRLEVLDSFGSDHFPVFIHLLHDPAAARVHKVPEADDEDRQEADEKIEDGLRPDAR